MAMAPGQHVEVGPLPGSSKANYVPHPDGIQNNELAAPFQRSKANYGHYPSRQKRGQLLKIHYSYATQGTTITFFWHWGTASDILPLIWPYGDDP